MEANKKSELIFRLLKKTRYLKDIDERKIYKLADIAQIQQSKKGSVLLHQAEQNQEVFIIIKGSVSVYVDQEYIYDLCRSGDIFGEMSVLTGAPSNSTIKTNKNVDLIRIPSLTLRDIHQDTKHEFHSALYNWFSNILTDKLFKTSQKAKRFEIVYRKLQTDLVDAKSTQDRIFSAHTYPIKNFPLTMKCEFSNILGGDLYAVFPVDETRYGILIGDVSGHGTGACLISMMALNLFMAFSSKIHSSRKVVETVNKMSSQFMHQGKFITAFYCIYDIKTCSITYTNAGHHSALVLRNNNIIVLPSTSGIPVGIMDNTIARYGEESFSLKKNDRLILFTDAAFESLPQAKQQIGFSGIIEHIQNLHKASSKKLIDSIYESSMAATQNNQRDDFTLMIFDQA